MLILGIADGIERELTSTHPSTPWHFCPCSAPSLSSSGTSNITTVWSPTLIRCIIADRLPVPHFESTHAVLGLITYILLLLQAFVGFTQFFVPSLYGGEENAKKIVRVRNTNVWTCQLTIHSTSTTVSLDTLSSFSSSPRPLPLQRPTTPAGFSVSIPGRSLLEAFFLLSVCLSQRPCSLFINVLTEFRCLPTHQEAESSVMVNEGVLVFSRSQSEFLFSLQTCIHVFLSMACLTHFLCQNTRFKGSSPIPSLHIPFSPHPQTSPCSMRSPE